MRKELDWNYDEREAIKIYVKQIFRND